MHGPQNPQCSVTPSWREASKTFNPEIKHTPANVPTHTHSQHIKEHTQTSLQHRNAGKLLYYINNGKCMYLYNGVPELSLRLFSYNHTNSKWDMKISFT
jgi:hypothetical protein